MANENKIQITISADGSAAASGINSVTGGIKKMEAETASIGGRIKDHWLGITAGVTAAMIAISKAVDYAKMGAAAMQAEEAFSAVAKSAGVSGDAIVAAMKKATAETIDDSELMQKAVKGMTQGLSGAEMVKIAEIARVAARTGGTTVGQAFEEITNSIANNVPRALRRFGLVSDEEIDKMSSKVKEGTKNVDLLATAYDRTREKAEQLGRLDINPAEKLQQYEKNITEVKEAIGKQIVTVAGGLAGIPLALGAATASHLLPLLTYSRENKKVIEEINKELERLDNLGKAAKWEKPKELEDTKEGLAEIKKQIDATTKAFAEMAGVIDKMGGMNLKFAGEDFQKSIKEQSDDLLKFTTQYQTLSDTMKSGLDLDKQISHVGDLTGAFSKYGSTIEDVYRNQISGQRDVFEEMKNNETIFTHAIDNISKSQIKDKSAVLEEIKKQYTAYQADVMKQAANVTQTEIKANEEKLSSYKNYYDTLKSMQKSYYDAAVKAASDMASIEKAMTTSKQQTADLQYEAWNKAFPAKDELEQYYRDSTRLDQQTAAAMSLSGEDRVQALNKIQNAYAGLSKEITTPEATMNTFNEVSTKIAAIGAAIAQAQEQMWADAAANRDKAAAAYASLVDPLKAVESEIKNIQTEIIKLDSLLAQQRFMSIDTSGALSGIQQIIDYRNAMSEFTQPPLPPKKEPQITNGLNWDGSSQVTYLDSLATGTDYVPRTGIYQLHQGEMVIPANESKAGSVTVNLGGITINGANKDAKQLAREIAPEIRNELRRLESWQ